MSEQKDTDSTILLLNACITCDKSMIIKLIDTADINYHNGNNITSLIYSIINKWNDITKIIIDKKKIMNTKSRDFIYDDFYYIILKIINTSNLYVKNWTDIITQLVKFNAYKYLSQENKDKLLLLTCDYNLIDISYIFIQNGADINTYNFRGITCFHNICVNNLYKLACLFIDNGVDLYDQKHNIRSIMTKCLYYNNINIIRLLFDNMNIDFFIYFNRYRDYKIEPILDDINLDIDISDFLKEPDNFLYLPKVLIHLICGYVSNQKLYLL